MTLRITAQSGHSWDEDVDDAKAAMEAILEEHDDILSICILAADGTIDEEIYHA